MMRWIVRMVGGVLRCTSTHRHPSAIALACAFGLAIGFIPKDNLFVVSLVAAMCFLRMNYLLACSLMAIVSFAAPSADLVTNSFGQWLLESPSLQALWNRIASWPVLPWFRWNNSVVLGGFVVGMASFAPVYIVSILLIHRFARARNQSRIDAIVSEVSHYHIQVEADQRMREIREQEKNTLVDRQRSINKRGSRQHRFDATPGVEVAKPNVVVSRPAPAMAMMTQELPSQTSSAVLRETVIEIVRYRPKGQNLPSKKDANESTTRETAKIQPPMNPKPMDTVVTGQPQSPIEPAAQSPMNSSQVNGSSAVQATTLPMVQDGLTEKPREEALRYLLWHLSGVHRQQQRHQEPIS